MKFLLTILIICSLYHALGQQSRITVSKNSVKVADPIEIKLSIVLPSQSKLKISDKWDTLPVMFKNISGKRILAEDKFEITSWTKKSNTINDSIEWIVLAKAILWDSGTFIFPAFSYKVDSNFFQTDSLIFNCELEAKIEGKDLYEIRESFIDVDAAEKQAQEESNKIFYIIVLVVVFVVFLIIYLLIRKVRKRNQGDSKMEMSLSDRALLAVNELEKLQLWKLERHKDHFVELSFILRSYFSSHFQLNLLEKTSEETLLLLRQKNVSIEQINSIEIILKHADMVKFAKASLEENYILDLDNQARNCIKNTEGK